MNNELKMSLEAQCMVARDLVTAGFPITNHDFKLTVLTEDEIASVDELILRTGLVNTGLVYSDESIQQLKAIADKWRAGIVGKNLNMENFTEGFTGKGIINEIHDSNERMVLRNEFVYSQQLTRGKTYHARAVIAEIPTNNATELHATQEQLNYLQQSALKELMRMRKYIKQSGNPDLTSLGYKIKCLINFNSIRTGAHATPSKEPNWIDTLAECKREFREIMNEIDFGGDVITTEVGMCRNFTKTINEPMVAEAVIDVHCKERLEDSLHHQKELLEILKNNYIEMDDSLKNDIYTQEEQVKIDTFINICTKPMLNYKPILPNEYLENIQKLVVKMI